MAQAPERKYYVFIAGKVWGPFPAQQLPTLNGFGPKTPVAPEGATSPSQWKKAKSVAELSAIFTEPAPNPADSSP